MKLSTLRDHVEAPCPPCHHGLPTPCGTSSPRCCPTAPAYRRHSSAGLPPPPDRGPDRVRQADPGAAVRLLLRRDRRHHLLGHHDPGPPRRVDRGSGCSRSWPRIARESYDRIVGLVLDDIAVDGCITKAPGGGECRRPVPGRPAQTGHETLGAGRGLRHPAGPGPGRGEPARLPAAGPHPGPARPTSARCPTTSPSISTPATTRARPATSSPSAGCAGEIAHKGEKAPIQASQRWHVERTNAWHNAFNRLQRCYERREKVIDAFFDLADAIITVRSLIRQAWTTHRWDTRPATTAMINTSIRATSKRSSSTGLDYCSAAATGDR